MPKWFIINNIIRHQMTSQNRNFIKFGSHVFNERYLKSMECDIMKCTITLHESREDLQGHMIDDSFKCYPHSQCYKDMLTFHNSILSQTDAPKININIK